MKNYFLFLSFGLMIILNSCDKSINGKVIDNFNQPVEGIKIKIPNSAFESITDKNGNFKIEYAAGKFNIEFQKENYIPVTKELEISETKKYPLGQVDMIRIPKSEGVYFKGEKDFIQIPQINLVSENETQTMFGMKYVSGSKYFLPEENVFSIEIDSVGSVEIFDNVNITLLPIEAEGKNVAICKHSQAMWSNIFGKAVKEKVERIGLGVDVHLFTPEIGKVYVFIDLRGTQYTQSMTNTAFAVRFDKKI